MLVCRMVLPIFTRLKKKTTQQWFWNKSTSNICLRENVAWGPNGAKIKHNLHFLFIYFLEAPLEPQWHIFYIWVIFKTHVLDCLHYLHIANIDFAAIVRLQRDYIYDAIIHFNPDFVSYKISFVDRRITENKLKKLIACRFLISFINNVRLQYKKCIFECRFCYWFDQLKCT